MHTKPLPLKRRRLASLDDAAEYLGMNVKTIRRWIAQGRVPAYRAGTKTIRLDLDELDAAMLRRIPVAGDGPDEAA